MNQIVKPITALHSTTPVLRIFDVDHARAFYVGFLGFEVTFEHRFAAGFLLYLGITRSGCTLHLSEHHGDACPGALVRIRAEDIDALASELATRNYRGARPGRPEATAWSTRELSVVDPFGNRLVFFAPLGA
jgi:catechol 2,3-dioxygenase-like lactoylglutathione lyase family enzyme